jgi:L-2,4-diaminobutyrate transaminase
VSDIRGVGMLRGIGFGRPVGRAVYAEARRRGLLLRPGVDFVAVAPPLTTTPAEADEIVGIIDEAIAAVDSE